MDRSSPRTRNAPWNSVSPIRNGVSVSRLTSCSDFVEPSHPLAHMRKALSILFAGSALVSCTKSAPAPAPAPAEAPPGRVVFQPQQEPVAGDSGATFGRG